MGNACSNIVSSNPADVILLIFAIILLVVLCGCIWAFFYSIFLFIFSKWDDAKVKSARNSIRYMIIGIFLTVMLLFMGPTLLKLFRLKNSEMYSAKNIFGKMGNIISCLTTWVVSVVKDYPNNNPFGDTTDIYPSTSTESLDDWLTVYEL